MASLNKLVDKALLFGASAATIIFSEQIQVKEALARLCGESQCENWGRSLSCPPHVGGPSAFRDWQKQCPYAVVIKIDLPAWMLFSHERPQVMRLLHEIVAGVENEAVQMGFDQSKAFAGGSCKELFCDPYTDCRAISKEGKCRNPRLARPSMSGFGVSVADMMSTAGWSDQKAVSTLESDPEAMSWVAGLVLVG